jgi:hypothetical protein
MAFRASYRLMASTRCAGKLLARTLRPINDETASSRALDALSRAVPEEGREVVAPDTAPDLPPPLAPPPLPPPPPPPPPPPSAVACLLGARHGAEAATLKVAWRQKCSRSDARAAGFSLT